MINFLYTADPMLFAVMSLMSFSAALGVCVGYEFRNRKD